jgi:putative colanic acid biosysnthesis UDP-glucose lipid carrier transferase
MFWLDMLSLNLAYLVSKHLLHILPKTHELQYLNFWIWLNISWLTVAWLADVYNDKHIFSFENFSRRTMRAFFYWLIFIGLYLFFGKYEISRLFIVSVFFSYGVLLFVNRWLLLIARSYLKKHKLLVRKVMIIGYNDTAKKLASYLEEDDINAQIVGFCEEEENVHELSNYPILDTIDNTITASRFYDVNEVYSTIAPEHHRGIYKLMKEADYACIHFRIIPDLSYIIKSAVFINYLKDIPVLSLRHEPLVDAGNRIRKRLFDVVFSLLVAIFILSWLIPLLGLIIYLESPGPIFFKQLRTGKDKKLFYCIKFRSMKINAEANIKQAVKNDIRITRFGRFLRKTNLDEFPQFLNVLLGNMSVVGPRPHMLKHTDDYSKLIDRYMVRQFLKPGITGWAQVNGLRGETKVLKQMQARVEHDIWYMENWSLWLDVKIILITIGNIITGEKNAY